MYHHHVNDAPIESVTRLILLGCIIKRLYQTNAFVNFPVNCHVLARALVPMIKARVATGYVIAVDDERKIHYNPHSWIPVQGGWIIDVKPIDMVSFCPLLVDVRPGKFGYAKYVGTSDAYLRRIVRGQETKDAIEKLKRKIAVACMQYPVTSEELKGFFRGNH